MIVITDNYPYLPREWLWRRLGFEPLILMTPKTARLRGILPPETSEPGPEVGHLVALPAQARSYFGVRDRLSAVGTSRARGPIHGIDANEARRRAGI